MPAAWPAGPAIPHKSVTSWLARQATEPLKPSAAGEQLRASAGQIAGWDHTVSLTANATQGRLTPSMSMPSPTTQMCSPKCTPSTMNAGRAAVSDAFTAAIRRFARDHQVPVVDFARGRRKDDVMHERLAGFTASEGVAFIGRAQEKNKVFRTERRRDRDGKPYPWITRSTGIINQWYFYRVAAGFGPFFLKFSSYFPFNARLCINGNHWAQRQAPRRGSAFEDLDNDIRLCRGPGRVAADL
jgi:hypothetical protein